MSRIEIYFNLHKKVFSVRHNGLILSHETCVLIKEPRFVVRESGRQRVLRERRKNVHAFITATSPEDVVVVPRGGHDMFLPPHRVYYNPYRSSTFVRVIPGDRGDKVTPIHHARWGLLRVDDTGRPFIWTHGPDPRTDNDNDNDDNNNNQSN